MKFKHTFHVFVDNFSITYKLLLYRIIISILFFCIYTAAVYPFISRVIDAIQFKSLSEAISNVWQAITQLDLNLIHDALLPLRDAINDFVTFISTMTAEIVWAIVIIVAVFFVQKFLHSFGNYTVGAMVNDKMALRADSPFIGTFVKNLGKAALYNLIYVTLSLLYDFACIALVYMLFFQALTFIPLIFKVFLFVTVIVVLIAIKMTFTTDWLPSLIYGKTNNRKAIKYSFTCKGKPISNVFSNMLVLILIIFAVNMAAVLLTLGAGLFITIPASYVLLVSFEFINYCDNNKVRYFIDKDTIIKPEAEHPLTREEFFKGEK